MKPKNYSMFSKKSENNKNINDVVTEEKEEMINNGVVEDIEEISSNETEETVINLRKGIVIGCEKLNVREKPSKDSKALCIINKSEEVEIDMDAHVTSDFYKVITATGVEGYCMSKYINIK